MCVLILGVNVCMLYVCWMLLSNQIFELQQVEWSIPTLSTLTKWELTKWELTKWEVDQMGIDKEGINQNCCWCNFFHGVYMSTRKIYM